MPIHDWSRVDAGIFHGFHARWIARLAETLMPMLPTGYYAEAEQHASERVADVLTLRISPPTGDDHSHSLRSTDIKTALLELPKVAEHRTAKRNRKEKLRPRHVAIRHVSGHRVVALIEIVSPGNKDRGSHVEAFVDKAETAIASGVHVVAVDLFSPSRSAPAGLPARIWRRFERSPVVLPADRPLSFGSFVGRVPPDAYFEFRKIGDELPSFPLFLTDEKYLNLPLEATYSATFEYGPPYLREMLSQTAKA